VDLEMTHQTPTPVFDALLHWLRVLESIVFKVAVQTYRALHADAPLKAYFRLQQLTCTADEDFCPLPLIVCLLLPSSDFPVIR